MSQETLRREHNLELLRFNAAVGNRLMPAIGTSAITVHMHVVWSIMSLSGNASCFMF